MRKIEAVLRMGVCDVCSKLVPLYPDFRPLTHYSAGAECLSAGRVVMKLHADFVSVLYFDLNSGRGLDIVKRENLRQYLERFGTEPDSIEDLIRQVEE